MRRDLKQPSTLNKTAAKQFSDDSLFPLRRSAYHQYSRINNSIVKDELIKEGKDTSLGVLVSAVSAKVRLNFYLLQLTAFSVLDYHGPHAYISQWRTLSEADRDYYEGLASEDRERYRRECAVSVHQK